MASQTTYHQGGFIPAGPQQNRAEQWDNSGYTRWDTAGVQLEQRALTGAETARMAAADQADQASANGGDIRQKLGTALNINATYQAIASPTNAQNLAQIRALTKEVNALIRLSLDMLADTTGT